MEFEYIELSPLTPLHLLLTEAGPTERNDPSKTVDRGVNEGKAAEMAASLPFRRNADYLRAIWNVLAGFTGALASSSGCFALGARIAIPLLPAAPQISVRV
jgi:hypothetical protein